MSYSKIEQYLLENPIDRYEQNPYDLAALHLQVDKEQVRQAWRNLRRKGLVETESSQLVAMNITDGKAFDAKDYVFTEERREDGSVQIKDTVDRKLTDEELFERYGRNQKEWKIISVWFKDKQNGFLLSVHFAPKKKEIELNNQKDILIKELKSYSPVIQSIKYEDKEERNLLLELALFDVHFGKLSHKEEVGEDYDLKIAGKRYKDAVDDLLSKVNLSKVKKILFPLGNDLFNVDNINKTTSNFTPQDTDTRFHKMVTYVKNIIIETIDKLVLIAPVDVVIVAGNHDLAMTFLLGEILEAFYHNNENVDINNSPKLRKYYTFGKTSFLFTHGDREKHANLGMIFAAEEPKIWGASTQRYIQLGHYHHNKKINYLSNDEFQGFQIMTLPSLSPNDAWHSGKGFQALRQAKAYLFDESKGLVSEITHTI